MNRSRTTRTVAALVAALASAPLPATAPEPVAVAAEAAVAQPASPEPAPDRLRPWYADYPAATDIDGARVYADGPDAVAEVQWALDRFEDAGLALPHVEVWMHDDLSGCRTSDAPPPIGFTTERAGQRIVYSCGTRFTLLHELGHVYAYEHFTDEDRKAFVATRKADAWRADEWSRSGSEHAADVIAWGLHPEHVRPSRTLPNDDASLTEAFVLLTGTAPLP